MLRSLKCDLEKSIFNGGFVGAFIISTILCFTASVYTDSSTSKIYSVFEAVSSLDPKVIHKDYMLSSVFVFRQALSGYITMFIPIIAVFPFMVTFCAERNSGLMRFTITRTGKIKYSLSKFFACTISGGLSVFLGVCLFGIISAIVFPTLSSYNIESQELEFILSDGEFKTVLKTLVCSFVYGAISSLPAFFLSSFCKNPYVITCIPFMFIYIWDTALSKISLEFVVKNNFEMSQKIYAFMPNSIISVIDSGLEGTGKTSLLFNIIYIIVLFLGFVLIMNMRKDKGV